MKNFLLSAMAVLALSALNAQIFSSSDSADFATDWTSFDLDGDQNHWLANDFSGSGNAFYDARGGAAFSYSYSNSTGPLTPDNLFINVNAPVDCSTASNVTLSWVAGSGEATATTWYEETYAVYAVTDYTQITMGNFPTPVFTDTLSAGGTAFTESIDISAIADGQSTVYIAFRHYNCQDEFALVIDDVVVNGDFASVEDNSLSVLKAFPNPAVEVLNITLNENAANVAIMTLDGKVMINNNTLNSTNVSVDVTDLAAGMYVYEVTTKDGRKVRNTFVKG